MRRTEQFGIEHPVVSAPMALISVGRLAASVVADIVARAALVLGRAADVTKKG
ncbi:hypothetical protein [Mycobacterium sp.]|uniref:hypothetical protein n=1 Tax=Mycobacterium sp. TaxID=1785 RepID=UPI0025DE5849|nr:hypothetical protein [Mycobacterium sp.]